MSRRPNLIEEKSFSFALSVVRLFGTMKGEGERILGRQLLRSGTSVGANVSEALAGSSKRDFIAKMNIALKEARESHYWLRLLAESGYGSPDSLVPLTSDANELVAILTSIVKTARQGVIR